MEIPTSRPYLPERDRQQFLEAVNEILESGRLTQGPWVDRFESAFARYTGCDYAIATNSGTSALEILLRFHEVSDHEVILPTNSFVATANAVLFAGGKPVLADISADTLCLEPQEIRKRMTPKTKGVILVHVAGLITPDLEEIRHICNQNGLFLIEDAAHAAGAVYNSQKAGLLADGGAFSFYPTKILTTGEGGMVTTNIEACAWIAKSLRCHGIDTGSQSGMVRNQFIRAGYNWRMSEIQAALGYFQLKSLEESLSRRAGIARLYNRYLGDHEVLEVFDCPPLVRHSYYKFPVKFRNIGSIDAIRKNLRTKFGIQSGSIYWPPIHLQPFYQESLGYKMEDFPVSEDVLNRTMALPIFPELQERDVIYIVDAIKETVRLLMNSVN